MLITYSMLIMIKLDEKLNFGTFIKTKGKKNQTFNVDYETFSRTARILLYILINFITCLYDIKSIKAYIINAYAFFEYFIYA